MKIRQQKFRGKPLYYKKLMANARDFKIDLADDNDWYDFWHYHIDWRGRGNLSGRDRAAHLKALFTVFENILEQVKAYNKPCQTWLSINYGNSYEDALFFHTPNPNQNNFPYTFPGFEGCDIVPPFLKEFIADRYEISKLEEDGQQWYVIRLRNEV